MVLLATKPVRGKECSCYSARWNTSLSEQHPHSLSLLTPPVCEVKYIWGKTEEFHHEILLSMRETLRGLENSRTHVGKVDLGPLDEPHPWPIA